MCRGALSIWPRTRAMWVLGGGPQEGTVWEKNSPNPTSKNFSIYMLLWHVSELGTYWRFRHWVKNKIYWPNHIPLATEVIHAKYQCHTVHLKLVTCCYIIRDARCRTETVRQPFQDTTSIPSLEGEEYVIAVLLEQLSWWSKCMTRSIIKVTSSTSHKKTKHPSMRYATYTQAYTK